MFIRLIVIFLIIQLTRVISNSIYNGNLISTSGLNGTKGMIGWLYLFLILGIFTAAKKIPDLIEKATGMKMSGDLELNPFKNPMVAGMTGLGLAGTSMVAANGWGAFKRFRSLSTKLGDKNKTLSEIDSQISENNQNFLQSSAQGRSAIRNAYKNEQTARDAENSAWEEFQQHPNSSIFYNRLEKARAARIAATKAREDAQAALESDRAAYQSRSSELRAARRDAQSDYDSFKRFTQGQVASSLVGVATGAVAGAARGAVGARKANDLPGVLGEAKRARMRTTERRNERDSFADMRQEGTYTTGQRIEGMMDQFAGVMGDKSYGPGQASDLLKSLSNEISRIEHQRRRQDEMITERRPDPYSLSDSNLRRLVQSIDDSNDSAVRENLVQQTRTVLESLGRTHVDYSIVSGYIDAVSQSDALTDRLVDLYKQRSKLEDIKNIPDNPRGPGKP